jgi:hypothetical protein
MRSYTPKIKSNTNHSKLEIHIAHNISFDDPCLKTLSVDKFSLIYEEIKLNDGTKLSERCGDFMIGENLFGRLKFGIVY